MKSRSRPEVRAPTVTIPLLRRAGGGASLHPSHNCRIRRPEVGAFSFLGLWGQLDTWAGTSESGSGEQRWRVMGVTAGLCLSGGEGEGWRGRSGSAQVGGAEGQQTGLPGQPGAQEGGRLSRHALLHSLCCFCCLLPDLCLCQGNELSSLPDSSTFTPQHIAHAQ